MKKTDMIIENLKDVCILMLGVLLGGVALLISKDATTIAMIVIMSAVFIFTLLNGIFGFNKRIVNLGLHKRFMQFLDAVCSRGEE